jgi:hypothetical protein
MIIQDAELDKAFIYFTCAYYFHWTPKQVDEMEYYQIEMLLSILPGWKKKTQDALSDK